MTSAPDSPPGVPPSAVPAAAAAAPEPARGGRRLLDAVVFSASFAVMSLELAASRLFLPHFGSSIFVWGTLISVMLVSLSLGYLVGGRVVDRHDPRRVLAGLLLGAALWVAAADLAGPPLLAAGAPLGLVWGTLVFTLVLFLVPLAALGAATPAILKLRIHDPATVGTTSGDVFFLSSLGSVLGTLGTTFLFVPFLGTTRTIALVAGILGLLGAALLRRGRLPVAALALAGSGALLAWPPALVAPLQGELFAAESPYQYVRVVEQGGQRFLLLNSDRPFRSFNSVDGPGVLTGWYFDDMALAPALVSDPQRVLVLGMGTGTVVETLRAAWPDLVIDGVELDPLVLEAAARFFGHTPDDRLRLHAQGARAFVRQSDERWDVIVMDVFQNGPYLPFQLATREFYALLAERLTPGGVLVVNAQIVEEPLLNSIAVALPHVWTVRRKGNLVTFAGREPLALPTDAADPRVPALLRDGMAAALRDGAPYVGRPAPIFTDDLAPVELRIALHELQ
jgi:spermidine synthase